MSDGRGVVAPGSARDGRLGNRLREARLRQAVGVRELARRVGVSASLISQVELGRASPSVSTLSAIVNELGLSLDALLIEQPARGRDGTDEDLPLPAPTGSLPEGSRRDSGRAFPVVRRGGGKAIQLASGAHWGRLTPQTRQDVDFLSVRYEVGGASCPEDSLMRHCGHEYGHVVRGRLAVTIGFETYELEPGDSISFESTMPHRMFTLGEEPVEAIWFVVGRRGVPRVVRNQRVG